MSKQIGYIVSEDGSITTSSLLETFEETWVVDDAASDLLDLTTPGTLFRVTVEKIGVTRKGKLEVELDAPES